MKDNGLVADGGGGAGAGVTKLKVGDQGPFAPSSWARARHQ